MSGTFDAEISNSFIRNKCSSFAPEGLETTLFQNGCLAFRSPASSDLCLKLKSPMVIQTAASKHFTITNRYADPCGF
jgi:hypothetical protein